MRFLFAFLLMLSCFAAPSVWAQEQGDVVPAERKGSGLPVPRFVTLGSAEVRLRTGPGRIYPIEWIFVRAGMPVEILAEFDTWRRIRDWEGAEGWVHQSLLSGRRSVVVLGAMRFLHHAPDGASPVLARLEPGVIASLARCDHAWCKVSVGDYSGWILRSHIWGVYPQETIQ